MASVPAYAHSRFKALFAIVLASLATAVHAGCQVHNLLCEYRVNPIGIDTPQPRLSWQLTSDVRGTRQSARQILVATSPDLLSPEKADLWNSGKQTTSDTLQIPYSGKSLTSNQTAYWTVQSWDQNNSPSGWAPPARWTTSLLDSSQWKAQWIGTERDNGGPPLINSADWIWCPLSQDAIDSSSTADSRPPNTVRYFRTSFELPQNAIVKDSTLTFTVDNEADVSINGKSLAKHDDWKQLKTVNPAALLKPGIENIIAVQATNTGNKPGAAGLILALTVPLDDGSSYTVVTDSSWESSRAPDPNHSPAEWSTRAKEPAAWEPVHALGKLGIQPWIKISRGEHPVIPIFRKAFHAEKPIRRALVHVSGLGHYVLSVNGQKAGDHFLDPPWSDYEKTVYYNTFDVTDSIRQGENVLGVRLGKGFYNTAGDRRIHGAFYDRPLALLLQAHIEYSDGTTTTVKTDSTWKWTPGPLVHNSILGGSDYDARKLPAGWDTFGFNDETWKTAAITTKPAGVLRSASAPPMRTREEFKPTSIEEPVPGHFVYDFGQNASAAPRLKVRGRPGQTITLTWAEQRNGQDPYTNNGKGTVIQSGIGHGHISYTLRGDIGGEEWFSDLFYTGYQYLELTGGVPEGYPNPDNLPVVSDLTSVHVRSDQPIAGTFNTSNETWNRIDRMIDWAVRSNFGHVFTDCPTREKLGWLEVPWLMWASTASRYDMAAYGDKIVSDIRDSQLPTGQILTVAPTYPSFEGGFHYTPEWGAAGVFLPWYLYQWYEDQQVLETNFDMMRSFVDFMASSSKDFIPVAGLGDWYDYLPGEKLGASRFTPVDLTATAVFAGCADIVSSSAAVLGKPADAAKYSGLASEIRKAFNRKFRTGPGQYAHTSSPQTAHAMALVFNMVPDEERERTAQAIVDDLEKREWQQTSGDIGYRFLINALSQNGHSNVIFKILNRDKIGSYAYLVNSGWTSLPEAWNANPTSSMNHCMLGHIQEWFTQHLVGIAPALDSIGFQKILVQPTPGPGVNSASGTYESIRGPIKVSWKKSADTLTCDVQIPANTTALVRLPVPADAQITESGKPVTAAIGVKYLGRNGDREEFEIGSGSYAFLCDTQEQ